MHTMQMHQSYIRFSKQESWLIFASWDVSRMSIDPASHGIVYGVIVQLIVLPRQVLVICSREIVNVKEAIETEENNGGPLPEHLSYLQ